MKSELLKIKAKYGEKMMHLCRELFSTLLEEENQLFNLLESNFAYSKFLYEDLVKNDLIEEFKDYIYSLNDKKENNVNTEKTPRELLELAGYNLYQCHNEKDIQSFKKYYAPGEELCTFKVDRLKKCHVFFAIKKNVDDIKREEFKNPSRQDEYGTSVISIQFTKGNNNVISIKNRYNHTVRNPDATFSNNLENIIEGLTESFEKEYNLRIDGTHNNDFEIPNYVKASDGKYYKYNYEIDNIYYCVDNIIIDNFEVKNDFQEKEKYIVIDYFIIDLASKTIKLYDESFFDSFLNRFVDIECINITKDKITMTKTIDITLENKDVIKIKTNKYNQIISYQDNNLEIMENQFLSKNIYLENLYLPCVHTIKKDVLKENQFLEDLYLPKVKKIDWDFLVFNQSLKKIILPNVMDVEMNFLRYNNCIKEISFPNLEIISSNFMEYNQNLEKVNLPMLREVGSNFLAGNLELQELFLPSLKKVGSSFLYRNNQMKYIFLPKLLKVGTEFLMSNTSLVKMVAPKLMEIDDSFLFYNDSLKELILPKVQYIGETFLYNNNSLVILELPKLEFTSKHFLYKNNSLQSLELPELKSIGFCSLCCNKTLINFYAPKLKYIESEVLANNPILNNKKTIKQENALVKILKKFI